MFSPLHGFLERESVGLFTVAAAMNSGLAVDINASDTTPFTNASPYGSVYGTAVTYSGTTASNNTRELGWLLTPVSTNGPSLLNILTQVYDESVAAGGTAVVVMSKAGALIATDQFVASGGTAIKLDGTQAPGTIAGIASGQPRLLQGGDVARLKLIGAVVQRGLKLASFEIL
jgi:hypothetical protein